MSDCVHRVLLTLFIGVSAMTVALAQGGSPRPNTGNDQKGCTELDESFELNIPERRITETNYESGTAVELGASATNDFRLQVGVALHADAIDVTLRNVSGRVRFRGSLQRVLDALNSRSRSNPLR